MTDPKQHQFDAEKITKIAAELEQKERLKKVSDAVRFHEGSQKLRRIAEGKRIDKDLTDIDFAMDFDALADETAIDAEQRKNAITFLYEGLSDFIQLAPGSLALICAATGTGKSTLTANIAEALIRQNKRVLIIANEEKKTDVAARISCLQLDVSIHKYKHKEGLPDVIRQNIQNNIRNFTNVTIIGTDYKDNSLIVTSPEGMESLLTKAYSKFDAVIIDYYQNINNSINNPSFAPHEANAMFARSIDKIKNEIGCPIIIMAQIRRGDDDYKVRFEGSRLIMNKATDIFEVKIEKNQSRSLLVNHKDRWLSRQGDEVFVGYDSGKFVPYTPVFEERVRQRKIDTVEQLATSSTDTVSVVINLDEDDV